MKLNADILILEDEPLIRLLLSSQLEKVGALVAETDQCAEALRMIRSTRFDLAIMDYRLPDGCGLDLVRTLRAEAIALPVIMLSGEADRIPAEAGEDLNLAAIFSKPPDIEQILTLVRQIVGQDQPVAPPVQIGRYTLVTVDAASFSLPADVTWLALDCSAVSEEPAPGLFEFLSSAGSRVAVLGAGLVLREQISRLNSEVEWVADAAALAALARRRCVTGERAALLNAAVRIEEM